MKVVTPLKNNEKKSPSLSTTFINRFERSCATFGKEKNKCIVVNNTKLVCPKVNKIKI
jgi:hypothetical protein